MKKDKPSLAIVIEPMKKPEEEDSMMEMKVDLMKDLMKAMKGNKPEEALMLFQEMLYACKEEEY